MATRYSRRYFGRRYYRKYPYKKSSSKRKAIGNYKAALQQKDKTDVNLNIAHRFAVGCTQVTVGEDTFRTGVYAMNIWDLLRKSEFYQSYANMYDQVKINGITLKLSPTSWSFNTQGTNQFQAVTVCTAWDRTGLSSEQVKLIANNVPIEGDNIGVIGLDGNSDGLYVKINDELPTYSSAVTKNLNPGSSFTIKRYLYPSTLSEKSYYVNTSDLEEWYLKYDNQNYRFMGLPCQGVEGNPSDWINKISDVQIGELSESPANSGNPCYLMEDPSVPFKPTFLVGVLTPVNSQYYSNLPQESVLLSNPITFTVEADIQVTFRGLRKATIVK